MRLNPAVLVVEDEADLLFTIALALEFDGYRVLRAASGEEALRTLDEQEPDAVLLDIRLPGIDGWEVLSRLRQHPRFSRIPVVLLSAQVDSVTATRARDLGCQAYLAKPFSAGELRRVLESVLDRGEGLE